jgi:hypothetical protein
VIDSHRVTRDLRLPFVLLLLLATAGAFAAAQHLKLEPTPLRAVRVTKLFSPACECGDRLAEIRFRLRRSDRVTIVVTDAAGRVVRHVVSRERVGTEPVRFTWNGRGDAGAVVPDGMYRARVHLGGYGRTFELPNRIEVDTTPPQVRIAAAGPRTISPDGDGHADRIRIRYTLDEPAVTRLYVDGRPRVRVRGLPLAQKIDWSGRFGGRVRVGTQQLAVVARDEAGNVGRADQTIPVRIRFVSLPQRTIRVRPGARFGVRVDADAPAVAWRLGTHRGSGDPRRLLLRAPERPGRYVLRVRVGPHVARATVRVPGH